MSGELKFGEAWSRLEVTRVGRIVASKSAACHGGASSSMANSSRQFSGDKGRRRHRGMAWTSRGIQGLHDDGP